MSTLKRLIIFGGIITLLLVFCGYQSLQAVKDGARAYLFGYSLVLMDVTKKVMTAPESKRAPLNHFSHIQFYPDHNFREVVRPNNDTLYSTAWIDLTSGPLVLSVPDTDGRYYVMPFMDAWTNVFAMVGKRETGTGPGNFIITGPDWQGKAPKGMKTIESPTNMTWLIGRIQANGKDDFENVFKLQKQFTLTSLESWPSGSPNPARFIQNAPQGKGTDCALIVAQMAPQDFFSRLARLMGEQPSAPADAQIISMLETYDIRPGQPSAMEHAGPVKRALFQKGAALAAKKLNNNKQMDRSSENNWAVAREDIGIYGTNYTTRSFVSLIGLGALPPKEAAYPNAHKDIDGNPLSGQSLYRIHFEKGNTPPVDAFWSITMYDDRGFLVDNPIRRYTIGDRDRLAFNPDGSLDILIQHKKPGKNMCNWLPAPADTFAVTMRLYMPKNKFLSKEWKLPPIKKVTK